MKISILVDNYVPNQFELLGEPSFSCHIDAENTELLFDLGVSSLPFKNAKRMNLDLCSVNTVVLSHGHLDHTWGMNEYIKRHTGKLKPTLICHPDALKEKKYKRHKIGIKRNEGYWTERLQITKTKTPYWITNRLVFLGEIERKNEYENKKAIGKVLINGKWEDDYLFDDSALAYVSREGIVIIAGCSHSGICNIAEYARKVTGINKIRTIVGGFHLQNEIEDETEKKTLEYLMGLGLDAIYPCHCTNLRNKIEIGKRIKVGEIGTGSVLEF